MDGERKPWSVMIVDDDALIRRAIAIYFGHRDYEVIDAADGFACLEQLQLRAPDVILLDVSMPGIDGRETCRRIREFSDAPVILLTARAQETDRTQGMAAGANAYVTKPVSLKELEAKVRTYLPPAPTEGRAEAPAGAPA